MKSNKIIIAIVAIIVIAAGVYLWSSRNAQTGSIKIGIILPLTGNSAHLGEGVKNAVTLAQENLGATKYKYEFIFEDDALDPKRTATAATKLITVDHVDALISYTSGSGNVVAPIAEANKTFHFGIASDPKIAVGEHNFVLWLPVKEQAKVFVAELQKHGIKTIANFVQNQAGIKAADAALKVELANTDIKIVSDQTLNAGDKDFRSALAKSKESGADIYILSAFSPEVELLAKQAREAGITAPFTSINAFELAKDKTPFEGDWYVGEKAPLNGFIDAFRKRFGAEISLGTANVYDVVNLIVATAEKFPTKPTTEDLTTAMAATPTTTGVLGTITQGIDGFFGTQPIVKVIKDGKGVPLNQ